ncbi:hypothetical protein GE061_011433 [Apolygus lucorum]|uniref:Uncharacterized protein n=1 Tax=Apolygus lucorum TaxID=248454 RepID=A0A8S9XZG5_APOLU|nr:hypothetical protein GE061_011433 [Apolygus lucorum]
MTNNNSSNNNAANFERMRSPPNGKGAARGKKPRRQPPSPPRFGCRQTASPGQFVASPGQLMASPTQLAASPVSQGNLSFNFPPPLLLSLGNEWRPYAGFTEPPAPAALPPPPIHWTQPIAVA